MQWIKWTLMAAVGCFPAMTLAEEPAKKTEKPVDRPTFDFRIEVQTDEGKPHVLHLGNDGKQSEELARLLAQFGKRMEVKVAQREQEKNPQANAAMLRQLTEQLANKAVVVMHQQHRQHHKGTYLGVATSEPPTVLRKQLGLHEGMGLVIDAVMPDSPAAKAGLKEYDVVQKIDDQMIVNYEQFTVLVRDHKPGDDVKLSVIHEGKPVVLTAKLIEHDIEVAAGPGGREIEWYEAVVEPRNIKLWDATSGKHNPDAAGFRDKLVVPHGAGATTQPTYKIQLKKAEKESAPK